MGIVVLIAFIGLVIYLRRNAEAGIGCLRHGYVVDQGDVEESGNA